MADGKGNEDVSCNLENVFESLKKGLIGTDDVDLGCYLTAYRELYNFFVLLGGAFQFVSSDVIQKIKILDSLRSEEEVTKGSLQNFTSVKNMIEHEKNSKLLDNSKYVSGARTLLRLHRGLDFIQLFLGEISKLENDAKIGDVCKQSYDKTLGNFHTWIIKKTASFAMGYLPTKQDLLKKICKNDAAQMKRTVDILPEMLVTMGMAYDRTQELYTLHDLHSLP